MLTLIGVALLPALATAFPDFLQAIPNGGIVPDPCDGGMWFAPGHVDKWGGGLRNQFGADFHRAGNKWTPEVCFADSDGDGLTNGEELGDPDCDWQEGDWPNRTYAITNPAICEPAGMWPCPDYCGAVEVTDDSSEEEGSSESQEESWEKSDSKEEEGSEEWLEQLLNPLEDLTNMLFGIGKDSSEEESSEESSSEESSMESNETMSSEESSSEEDWLKELLDPAEVLGYLIFGSQEKESSEEDSDSMEWGAWNYTDWSAEWNETSSEESKSDESGSEESSEEDDLDMGELFTDPRVAFTLAMRSLHFIAETIFGEEE